MEYSTEERVYVSLYQRPLLQLYECNVKSTHRHTVMKYVNLNRDEKMADVNINFFIVQNIYFVFCFFI